MEITNVSTKSIIHPTNIVNIGIESEETETVVGRIDTQTVAAIETVSAIEKDELIAILFKLYIEIM